MDVALVNDGPVGVDYSSEDGVVNALFRCSCPDCLGDTDRKKQVTIEIDAGPPPMANPTKLELPEDATVKTKIKQSFTLPASLLE